MTQYHPEPAQPTQPSPKNDQEHYLTKLQWAICNLVTLLVGSGSNFSSFNDWVYNLHSQEPPALCNLSRDKLNANLGIQTRGLPSADINNDVQKLQGQVKTQVGRAFVFYEAGLKDLDPINREPIDYITWLYGVTDFDINWMDLDEKFYDLYVAILLGLVLGRLGKVIGPGTPITDVIPGIIEQYERNKGLLPDPFALRRASPPGPWSVLPPLGLRPSVPRPPIPQHSQLCPGNLPVWAPIIMFLLLLVIVFLLLLIMSTLVAPQRSYP